MKNNCLLDFDLSLGNLNLIGVDEVGRGCLAGDVFACAVSYREYPIQGAQDLKNINDSKKITPPKREILAVQIKKYSNWAIGKATVKEINEIGILNATFLAMRRAIFELDKKIQILRKSNSLVLVDGNIAIREFNHSQKVIKQGDATSFHIASASIIAKVARDQYMRELSTEYPEYRWSENKGYGTQKHNEAIKQHGINEHHRNLFVRNLIGNTTKQSNKITQTQLFRT